MDMLKKLDAGWARVEGWLTVTVLLMMVLIAGWQAFIRNMTRFDVQWANELLTDLEWADSFLRKGTMWLAFLGASLATRAGKNIGIDVLTRIAPVKAKYTMMALAAISGGIITLGLTYSFSSAVHLNLTERPIEYELLGKEGSIHVCDATQAAVDDLEDFDKPTIFCAFRAALGAVGVPAETPGAAFQLIVPLMFFVIALRLLAQGTASVLVLAGGPTTIAHAEEEERKSIAAQSMDMSIAPAAPTKDAKASEESKEPDDPGSPGEPDETGDDEGEKS